MLLGLDGVVDVTVRGEASPLVGQYVVARVSLSRPEPVAELKARLRRYCQGRLAPYMIPAQVEIAEGPQANARGKRVRAPGGCLGDEVPAMIGHRSRRAPSPAGDDWPGPPGPARPRRGLGRGAKAAGKAVGNALALAAGALPAALCWAEARLSSRSEVFLFWGQALALVPGLPGKYLRRGFYRLTLRACSSSCYIGFLSHFSRRQAEVGRRVYIGCGVTIGAVSLGDGTLVGSRSSLLSGGHQHRFGPDGRLTPFDPAAADAGPDRRGDLDRRGRGDHGRRRQPLHRRRRQRRLQPGARRLPRRRQPRPLHPADEERHETRDTRHETG